MLAHVGGSWRRLVNIISILVFPAEAPVSRLSLRPTEVPFMFSFLLSGSEIDHPHIVEHPEALASIFVEYTGRRKDLVFGEVVWLSQYRSVNLHRHKFFKSYLHHADPAFAW